MHEIRPQSSRLQRRNAPITALGTLLLAGVLSFACASEESNDEGSAGMSAGPPTVGMPCMGACADGLSCVSSGRFARQCTAGCNNGAACQVVPNAAGSQCFGTVMPQCGLPCSASTPCPAGTGCQMLDTGMACTIAGLAP